MLRWLQKHGDGVALVFDEEMLAALNMTATTPVHVTFQNGTLIVASASIAIAPNELADAIARLRPRYETMLKNLAK